MQPSAIWLHCAPDNFGKLLSGDVGHRLDALFAEHPSDKVGVVFAPINSLKNAHRNFGARKFVELGKQHLTGIAVKGIRQLGEPGDKPLVQRWRG